MNSTFGRTNRPFPKTWLSLRPPESFDQFRELAEVAAATGLPLDVTIGALVWGACLPAECGPLVAFLTTDFDKARNREDACDYVSAQIVQILSSLCGRPLAFLFVPVKNALEEFQWDGALQAIESAREDGLVEFAGLSCEGPPLAAIGAWQFRDAFEALCLRNPADLAVLEPLASERRVGIVTTSSQVIPGACLLVPVGDAAQVAQVRIKDVVIP